MIPYGRQDIGDDDIKAVVEVLRSDWLTQGPKVPEFESALAGVTGARHAVAVNSATSALHLACMALGLGPGSLLWTSPNTFVASANCARYCGADVDFVDIDPATYNISPGALSEKLASAAIAGRLPDVLVAVHHSGQSCDMPAINALARKYGIRVIEDASHAIGARFDGEPVGSCLYSDIAVLSFHPVKIVTTGEGGAALTNEDEIAAQLRLLRSHGITRDADEMAASDPAPWYYEQIALGFNYRMTELQAALGLAQLSRLSGFIAARESLARRYDAALSDLDLSIPWQDPRSESARHLYVIRLDLQRLEVSRRQVFEGLRAAGIGVNVHYIPVHTQPYYRALGFEFGDFPESERYYDEAITLPLFPNLTHTQQDMVVSTLHRLLTKV